VASTEPEPKPPEDLDGMVSHIRYEVVRLVYFLRIGNRWVERVVGLPPGWGEFAVQSMLEAALIHTRCVAEFLRRTNQPENTITAKDYVPAWHWMEGEGLKDDLAEIHGRVAHLGLIRLSVQHDGEDFTWREFLTRSAVPTLLAGFLEFLDRLDPELRQRFDRPQGGEQVTLTDAINLVLGRSAT
jgi:hypothetical protein